MTTKHDEEINRLRVLLEGSANLVQVSDLLALVIVVFMVFVFFSTFSNLTLSSDAQQFVLL